MAKEVLRLVMRLYQPDNSEEIKKARNKYFGEFGDLQYIRMADVIKINIDSERFYSRMTRKIKVAHKYLQELRQLCFRNNLLSEEELKTGFGQFEIDLDRQTERLEDELNAYISVYRNADYITEVLSKLSGNYDNKSDEEEDDKTTKTYQKEP